MPEKTPRPAWLADGKTVYAVAGRTFDGGYSVNPRRVIRATATQVIVTPLDGSREERFRLDTLHPVGADRYGSPELAPAGDPRVQDALSRAKVRKATAPLRELWEELSKGNAIGTTDAVLAREYVTRVRDAAQSALDNL
jgi:hypothetical protein